MVSVKRERLVRSHVLITENLLLYLHLCCPCFDILTYLLQPFSDSESIETLVESDLDKISKGGDEAVKV